MSEATMLIVSVFVQACATPYQIDDFKGSYSETRLGNKMLVMIEFPFMDAT